MRLRRNPATVQVMSKPLVIAYHLVWTAYGWWLPNDPRGSMSRNVENESIAALGLPHFGRRRSQPPSLLIRRFYRHAADVLKYPLLVFQEPERTLIGDAFRGIVLARRYTCYACAIMPDHVHLVVRKHRDSAEQMIHEFQGASRLGLATAEVRVGDHPVWGGPGWKVFLDHPDEVRRTMRYVEENPPHIGLPRQSWDFVVPYDGWPLHPGHSLNSPYARALRRVGRYPESRG